MRMRSLGRVATWTFPKYTNSIQFFVVKVRKHLSLECLKITFELCHYFGKGRDKRSENVTKSQDQADFFTLRGSFLQINHIHNTLGKFLPLLSFCACKLFDRNDNETPFLDFFVTLDSCRSPNTCFTSVVRLSSVSENIKILSWGTNSVFHLTEASIRSITCRNVPSALVSPKGVFMNM